VGVVLPLMSVMCCKSQSHVVARIRTVEPQDLHGILPSRVILCASMTVFLVVGRLSMAGDRNGDGQLPQLR